MSNYSYKILFDKKKDAWNWLDSSKDRIFSGYDWINNLSEEVDIRLFNNLSEIDNQNEAELIIETFLSEKYKNEEEIINKYLKYINSDFENKFEKACEKIVELTSRDLYVKDYKFYLTTFPRCPYDESRGEIFFYITLRYDWADVIENFMHEALHFQFIYYWRKNSQSIVSKMSEDDFDLLKESLTVVLDENLIPLIEKPDTGYESQREFRNKLHKFWTKNHNFDKLVDYGITLIGKSKVS